MVLQIIAYLDFAHIESAYVTLIALSAAIWVSWSHPEGRSVYSREKNVPLIIRNKVENVFIKKLYFHWSRYL
jgi:hypothetical protein